MSRLPSFGVALSPYPTVSTIPSLPSATYNLPSHRSSPVDPLPLCRSLELSAWCRWPVFLANLQPPPATLTVRTVGGRKNGRGEGERKVHLTYIMPPWLSTCSGAHKQRHTFSPVTCPSYNYNAQLLYALTELRLQSCFSITFN